MPLFDIKGIAPQQPKTKAKPTQPTGSLFQVGAKPKAPVEYTPKFIRDGQFSPEDEPIAAKIQQRRLQLLIHSYIYYRLDVNIVEDSQWSEWAFELAQLQKDYPKIAEQVVYSEPFIEWDGSTGAHLEFDDWVIHKAEQLVSRRNL